MEAQGQPADGHVLSQSSRDSPAHAAAMTLCRKCASCDFRSDVAAAFRKHHWPLYWVETQHCLRCWQGRHDRREFIGYWLVLLSLGGLGGTGLIMFSNSACALWCWILWFAFLANVSIAITTIVHEAAHGICGHLLGYRVYCITIGFGTRAFEFVIGSTRVEVSAIPWSGETWMVHPEKQQGVCKAFLVTLAGPLVDVIGVAGALLVLYWFKQMMSGMAVVALVFFILVNAVFIAISLFPRLVTTSADAARSDVSRLLQMVRCSSADLEQDHAAYFAIEGMECCRREQFRAAVDWHRQGLAQYPDDMQNRLGLGYALCQLREFDQARQEWLAALENANMDPAYRHLLLNNIAVVDLLLRPAETIEHVHDGAADSAKSAEAVDQLDALLDEADRFSQEALNYQPTMPHYQGTRAFVLIEKGDLTLGLDLLQKVLDKGDDLLDRAFRHCYLAIAEAKGGHLQKSTTSLEVARSMDRNCPALPKALQVVRILGPATVE